MAPKKPPPKRGWVGSTPRLIRASVSSSSDDDVVINQLRQFNESESEQEELVEQIKVEDNDIEELVEEQIEVEDRDRRIRRRDRGRRYRDRRRVRRQS